MSQHFDAIVIGTGQSGPSSCGASRRHRLSVAIIERGKFGGTCVNNGCIPTKTLVASAYAAHLARRAGEYGVETAARCGSTCSESRHVKTRSRATPPAASNIGCADYARNRVYQGHARFVGRTACRSEMMCWRLTASSSTLVADHSSRQCPDWSRRHS